MADETDTALAAFGLVAGGSEEIASEPFKVYAVNWETLQVFWSTWNQWRKVALGNQVVRDGIDWMQIESVLRLSGIKRGKWPLIFEGLKSMEIEALEFLNQE